MTNVSCGSLSDQIGRRIVAPSIGPVPLHELTFSFVLNSALGSPTCFQGHPRLRVQPLLTEALGKRASVRRDGPTVRLYSRNAHDWTARPSAIATAAQRIKAKSFTIDGEAVVLGPDGL